MNIEVTGGLTRLCCMVGCPLLLRPSCITNLVCNCQHKVNLLVVPHQKSNKYSEKAFAVVGPRLWNELLTDELRGCNSVDTFKKKLKTMLFKKHY